MVAKARGLFGLVIVAWLTACSFAPPQLNRDADVIVVGDSILAWHRGTGRSIPEIVADATGLSVSNVAVNGARFLGEAGIPAQYATSDWDWVILDGGGNDLLPVCGTPNAQVVLDNLISADGRSGAMPAFIRRAAGDGARVIVLGYYPVSDQGGPFVGCESALDELAARQAAMADQSQSVFFVDAGLVVGPMDAAAYAPDLVHPSPRGAALVGQLISSTMRRNGG